MEFPAISRKKAGAEEKILCKHQFSHSHPFFAERVLLCAKENIERTNERTERVKYKVGKEKISHEAFLDEMDKGNNIDIHIRMYVYVLYLYVLGTLGSIQFCIVGRSQSSNTTAPLAIFCRSPGKLLM